MGNPRKGNAGLVAAVVGLAAMSAAGILSTFHDRGHEDDPAPAPPGGTSIANCHRAVRTQFAKPETVNFHPVGETISEFAAGWRMTGTLDALEGPGGTTNFDYACTTDADGTVLTDIHGRALGDNSSD